MLVVGRFASIFLFVVDTFRSFQVVSYSLWIISGRFLLAVVHFRSFPARCRSFQVISDCFFCLLQVVSGCFRSFQVVPRFSMYLLKNILMRTKKVYTKKVWSAVRSILNVKQKQISTVKLKLLKIKQFPISAQQQIILTTSLLVLLVRLTKRLDPVAKPLTTIYAIQTKIPFT